MAVERKEAVLIPDPPWARWLFSSTRSAWLWLVVRLYLGFQWWEAGIDKVGSPVWTGDRAGVALAGFIRGAMEKTAGAHPDVQQWYAAFLERMVLPNAAFFSHVVAYGEVFVGVALIVGFLTGIAAFFGSFMNFNFLLAGTVSVNPILFAPATFLVLAWKVAGWYGLDRWLIPALGAPWEPGRMLRPRET